MFIHLKKIINITLISSYRSFPCIKEIKIFFFYFGWDLWDHQLTGSMTSTFLTVWSGATAGQSDSSWYPVALLLRL